MTIAERFTRGISTFDHDPVHHARNLRKRNTAYLANVLLDSGLLVGITRPTVRQFKKDMISFFGSVEVDKTELKIPIVVKTSCSAAQRYRDENLHNIKRKGIIIIVARDEMEPQALRDSFRRNLAQHLNILLQEHAGVAELVNAPV